MISKDSLVCSERDFFFLAVRKFQDLFGQQLYNINKGSNGGIVYIQPSVLWDKRVRSITYFSTVLH